MTFDNDGQDLYPRCPRGAGHGEELKPAFLKKDQPIAWKRPFQPDGRRNWTKLKASFGFRTGASEIWRGVPGSYKYPVWFDGSGRLLHLARKFRPRANRSFGLKAGHTPSVSTPVDILKETLGGRRRDFDQRSAANASSAGGDGAHRACTCGCTSRPCSPRAKRPPARTTFQRPSRT